MRRKGQREKGRRQEKDGGREREGEGNLLGVQAGSEQWNKADMNSLCLW